MKRKILVSAVTLCALGTAGIAFAEGTSGTQKEERDPAAQSGTMQGQGTQQGMQQGTQQGTQQDTTAEQGSDIGSEQQADVGQESESMQQAEPAKQGVARLDSVRISSLDDEHARMLQQKLADLGYYKAEVDGKFGPKSKAALSQYFRDQAQLVAQGKVSESALTALGFDDSAIERVRGIDVEGDQERTPTPGTDVEEGVEPSGDTGSGSGSNTGDMENPGGTPQQGSDFEP